MHSRNWETHRKSSFYYASWSTSHMAIRLPKRRETLQPFIEIQICLIRKLNLESSFDENKQTRCIQTSSELTRWSAVKIDGACVVFIVDRKQSQLHNEKRFLWLVDHKQSIEMSKNRSVYKQNTATGTLFSSNFCLDSWLGIVSLNIKTVETINCQQEEKNCEGIRPTEK
jgi:hypothetical protein